MGVITAKELKQRTGEVIRRVRTGERLTVTYRGKPVAVIAPPGQTEDESIEGLRSFNVAWKDIEQTLQKTEAGFRNWQEAMAWARKRRQS